MSNHVVTATRPDVRAWAGFAGGPEARPLLATAEAVHRVLSLSDEELDYALAKLALDAIVDPTTDVDAVGAELDRLSAAARLMIAPDATEADSLSALRTLIYEAGPWNDHRPFAYDHDDPHGRIIRNKLLSNYLTTRRGQCVSMPILFLILADRLGLNVALASAPDHIFLRYVAPDGRTFNLEATSGGHPAREDWYAKNFPMSDRALENGLYMRTLTRRETVALMATTVLEHLRAERRYEELIACCRVVRRYDPRAAVVMVVEGSAYGALIAQDFESRYPVPFLIPEPLRMRFLHLTRLNNSLLDAAAALGWEPPD